MNFFAPIDVVAWSDFEQYLTTHSIKKGELLWKEGDVIKQIIFITKGAMRYYYHNHPSDKEVIAQFFFENAFLTDYVSFNTQEPTDYYFQALEDTEYIAFPRVAIYQMYDKYKVFERIGRLIAEYNFIHQQNAFKDQKNLTPEEKYLKIVKERPKVIARIPLHMIASYLAITPEHLSRIRKKISAG
jgi:CRP-like cAMP-binding protein